MASHYVTHQQAQHPATLQQQLSHEHMLYTSSGGQGAINTCASVAQAVNTDVGKSYMYFCSCSSKFTLYIRMTIGCASIP